MLFLGSQLTARLGSRRMFMSRSASSPAQGMVAP
jgi:hypothetical protein